MSTVVPKCVYICSAGHSGSTLLDLVLGSHSRIESLGEISFLPQNLAINLKCSCGKPVRECEVWKAIVARLSERSGTDLMQNPYALHMGNHLRAFVTIDRAFQTPLFLMRRRLILGLNYLRYRFGWDFLAPLVRSTDHGIANNFAVYDAARAVMQVDTVVDSSKSYLKAVGLYRHDPQAVRVILLTRDGRGMLYSNMKRDRERAKSVTEWVHQYERALSLFGRHIDPAHLLQVKYEDLAADPPRELERICGFLGLPFEPGMLDFSSVPHHSTDGNDIRFLRTFEIRLDTKWQQGLSPEDLRYFERRAGALNRKLGYS